MTTVLWVRKNQAANRFQALLCSDVPGSLGTVTARCVSSADELPSTLHHLQCSLTDGAALGLPPANLDLVDG